MTAPESPYREGGGDPDADARETLAIQRYGAWSMRVRSRVVSVFAGLGLVGAIATVVASAFARLFSVPLVLVVLAAALVGAGAVAIGAAVARRTVRRLAPAKLLELAAAHEVPVQRLEQTTALANTL